MDTQALCQGRRQRGGLCGSGGSGDRSPAATAHLIHGYFVCQPFGALALKRVAQPLPVYQVLQESDAQTRLDIVTSRGLTPLVGRDEDVALLQRLWEQAVTGMGQVVLLSGEAGIGKSRLVQMLKEHSTSVPHTRMEWRGSPYHQQSALYPVIEHLQRLLRGQHNAPSTEPWCILEAVLTASGMALAEAVPLLAVLLALPLPHAYPPLTLTPQRQRQHTLHIFLRWLHASAQQQPALLIVEDLHWVDPSTLELLSLLIDQCATLRLCLVLTARPEFHPPWAMVAHLTALTLRRLAPAEVGCLVRHVVGTNALPPAVLQEVVRKTDGIPLFVEELTKTVLTSGLLEEREDRLSEARWLTADRVDLRADLVVCETVKKRRSGVSRAVPVPHALVDMLDLVHGLRPLQGRSDRGCSHRLGSWSRMTGWRRVCGGRRPVPRAYAMGVAWRR